MIAALIAAQFVAISLALLLTIIRRVPFSLFKCFLAFELILGVVSIWARSQSQLSLKVWIWGQLMTAVLWLSVFAEVRKFVVRDYPGIGPIADKIVGLCLGIGALAMWLTANDNHSVMMRLAVFVPRVVSGSLTVGMLLLGALMRHHPSLGHPNTEAHSRIFWLFMGTQALSLWAGNLVSRDLLPTVTVVRMVLSLLCFSCWIFFLARHSEVVLKPIISAADLERAQQQSRRAVDELKEYVD